MRPRGLALAAAVVRAEQTLRHTEERARLTVERARKELVTLQKQFEIEVSRDPVVAGTPKRTWHVGMK